MNKKLIALAVAGACVAPAAMAQTANPVTLYGRVHVTLESVEAKGGTTAQNDASKRRNRIQDQASLLGVRGTEDLGGGLKAFFQLETAFRPDSNDTTFAARNSAVGLQGGWGSVLFGRWDTPMKVTAGSIDPYGDVTISGYTGVMADRNNFDRRDQNTVQYWSPTWGGLAVRLHLTANEGKTATASPYDSGASVTYTGGPVMVGYAYEQHKDQSASTSAGPAAASAGNKQTGHALVGSFTFGPVKVAGLYQKFKKTALTDQKAWLANAVYTMGRNQLILEYATAKDGAAASAAVQPDCEVWNAGWQYNFTRRTFFLATYARYTNNSAANCGVGVTGVGVAGQDPRGVSLGLRHIF